MNSGNPNKLVLWGYVPTTRNALKGVHWSVLYHEKIRAGLNLLSALESGSPSTLFGPPTGTDTTSRNSKTCSSTLRSYLQTSGAFSKGKSSLKRHTRKKSKGPKLKSGFEPKINEDDPRIER